MNVEREKARAQSTKHREKLKNEAGARQIAERELQKQRDEDLRVLKSLCRDVTATLKRQQRTKQAIAGLGALVLAILTFLPFPYQIEPSWMLRLVGLAATIVMTYLTITGSSLLRLDIGENQALRELDGMAQKRALSGKLERHRVTWNDGAFTITGKAGQERANLL
ncbi:hypothetical protein [Aquamicrobium ahrensii]|uniref:Uncharacterized protein n=1 Tax=Aquamicrobium ahrensii TaxID=469551 RepID=A0ABV2KQ24_9HYPH